MWIRGILAVAHAGSRAAKVLIVLRDAYAASVLASQLCLAVPGVPGLVRGAKELVIVFAWLIILQRLLLLSPRRIVKAVLLLHARLGKVRWLHVAKVLRPVP